MQPPSDRPQVYLVDASVYVFRAWFSIPDSMTTGAGEPCNAAYGFANFLTDLLRRTNPHPVAVAFDESLTSSWRNEIYPEYKANRPPAPEALKRQFAWCRGLCEGLGLATESSSRYEADDLIGAWAEQARARGDAVVVVTRDKDLAQLIGPQDRLWDFAGDKWLDPEGVLAQYGVRPAQIADFLAITGDSVDNIPGVRGIGAKGAAALIGHFGSLDEIYARLDEVPEVNVRGAKRMRDSLERDAEQVRLARRLTAIPTDFELPAPPRARQAGDPQALDALCDELGFGRGLRERLLDASRA